MENFNRPQHETPQDDQRNEETLDESINAETQDDPARLHLMETIKMFADYRRQLQEQQKIIDDAVKNGVILIP